MLMTESECDRMCESGKTFKINKLLFVFFIYL